MDEHMSRWPERVQPFVVLELIPVTLWRHFIEGGVSIARSSIG